MNKNFKINFSNKRLKKKNEKKNYKGMGNLENFKLFKRKCIDAYLYLRKYAKLILNLFQLMIDSGIKDITQEALYKMSEKFCMEENDEFAEKHFLEIIEKSTEALFPVITDAIHKWVVVFRR